MYHTPSFPATAVGCPSIKEDYSVDTAQQIVRAVERQEALNKELFGSIDLLAERLFPILLMDGPSDPSNAEAPRPVQSPLADTLSRHADETYTAIGRIRRLIAKMTI